MHGWDADVFADRARAYGWSALEIDGHDADAIDRAYRDAVADERPTMIVARTEKGHGVSFLADQEGWHGKAVSADREQDAIAELGGIRDLRITPPSPPEWAPVRIGEPEASDPPSYEGPIATRKAFGDALVWLAGHRPDLVVLDGEVGNSTYAEDFEGVAPERFVQLFIAEQTMLGVQTGLQALGKTAFAATFGAFFTRAYDQIRMGSISRADLRLCGSHAGISIGEDGPSQMALEDLASLRAVHGSTVLYPSDPNQTAALVPQMADRAGIVYMRTTREKTPILYEPGEEFHIGGSRVVRRTDDDVVTLIGAGITLHEAVKAAGQLGTEGIDARVIDLYSVKPIDTETVRAAARETGAIITVEDHWPEGGIGDAVLDALAEEQPHPIVVKLAVRAMPGSGTPTELLAAAGIDADHIAAAARELVGRAGTRGRSKAEVGSGRRE